jgi:phosphate transport system substrate-binding protein
MLKGASTFMTRIRTVGVLAVATAMAAAPAAANAKTSITMSGSTSVAPLAAKLAKSYVKTHRGVQFKLAQGGSDIGVADVARGRVTIGNSSRDPKPTDPGGIVFNKVARDAVCLVTNPANPIASLSQKQVQAIFSGEVRNWSEVPGAGVSGPIDVLVRSAPSGTQDAFQKLFMGTKQVTTSASQKASSGLVAQGVLSDKNAIGYVSLEFTKKLHDAGYQGVACNLRNAKSGQYAGTRNFWMVTRGAPTGGAAKFIKWVQRSSAANRIIAKEWVPIH